ncbi:MAG: hypothetical protein AAGI15_17875, partial [Pseudomonadota bacterium]
MTALLHRGLLLAALLLTISGCGESPGSNATETNAAAAAAVPTDNAPAALSGEVNVYSSRHYDTDAAL